MSSLIERQAAIETVRKAKSIGQAHRMLLQLPSAQPDVFDTNVGKICEYYDLCRNGRDEKKLREELLSAQPGCEDTVYRKAVQMLLAYFVPEERYAEAVDGLRRLPSAQPRVSKKEIRRKEKNMQNIGLQKLRNCPFCGSEVDFMNLVTPIKMFYCKNHHGCGAIVSFDTPLCNRFDKAKIDAWNRREGGQE